MPRSTQADTIAALRQSLGHWYLASNPGYQWVEYQQERVLKPIQQFLEGKFNTDRLALFMSPGHSKTDCATKATIPWYLGNHPGHGAMSLSYSDDLANVFGRHIKTTCSEDLTLAVWPTLEMAKDSRSNRLFNTVGANTYHACGFDGKVAGNRVNLIVIDDPVKHMADARSEAIQSHLVEVYRSVIKNRLRPNGKIILCMTRFHLRDFAGRVLDAEPDDWTVIKVPAENPDGSYLWESHYGKAWYEDKKRDREMWWALHMQEPSAFADAWFRKDWLHYYTDPIPPKKFPTYLIVDPAYSQHDKADRTSIVVLCSGPERRIFIVDWVLDRLDPGQRMDAICRLMRRWQPRRLLYEEAGLTADMYYVRERFQKEGFGIRPIGVGGHGKRKTMPKEQRIRELIPDFEQGKIWLPMRMVKTLVDGTEFDIIKYFVDEEFLPYRGQDTTRHDDALDSLSRIHEEEMRIEYPLAELMAVPPPQPRRLGTWEAYW